MTFRLRTTGGYARPLPQPAVFEQPCSLRLLPIVAPVSSAPKALVAPWALTMLRLRREVQPALREGHGNFIADNIPVPELPLDGMRIVSFERHGAPAKPPVLSERLPDWKRPTAAPRCARILFPDLPGPWDHQPNGPNPCSGRSSPGLIRRRCP